MRKDRLQCDSEGFGVDGESGFHCAVPITRKGGREFQDRPLIIAR
jgi:hypothetical protein